MSLRRWRNRLAVIVGALTLVLAGAVVLAEPVLAAIACPACFGFERLSGTVYVDRAMTDEERTAFQRALAEADARLMAFYGDVVAPPIVLACSTDACNGRLHGGGARGAAYLTIALRLAPRGLNATIIAHERSHIELHSRIGFWRLAEGAIPAWFDEGLAVVVSEDERYLLPPGPGDRCRLEPGEALPASARDWRRTAGRDPELYARTACRVLRWIDGHGGSGAVLRLAKRIHDGASFEDAYRGPLDF